ncbi:aldolase/citrate lyase family protein [Orientia tsutsugamushi]|uniref:HpcH/HpaI aldolase/citrate lyase family protein n=1 Tax=Orientia tsutsugamushi TaxID=784 RepID=UPI00315D2DB2
MRNTIYGAHLFVPANNVGFITNIPLVKINNIIIDLEYATNFTEKKAARFLCKNSIPFIRKLCPKINITVRINIPSLIEICREDLKIVLQAEPDSIRVPSVNTAKQLQNIVDLISLYSKEYSIQQVIKLHPMIETPEGVNNIDEIAKVSDRNQALCLGGEDWVKNLGMKRTKTSEELNYIRSLVNLYATKNDLYAIDSVYPWLDDLDALELDSINSKNMGFCARAIQNPRQINIVNKVYYLTVEQKSYAQQIIEQTKIIELGESKMFLLNDKIIDPLIYQRAQKDIENC